jgi:hypothetical protein
MTPRAWPVALVLCISPLAGCVSFYTPSLSASAKARPTYQADLDACRNEAAAKKDANYWNALGNQMIPIVGMAQYFDANNPSSIPGEHKNVDDCMKAKGYEQQAE